MHGHAILKVTTTIKKGDQQDNMDIRGELRESWLQTGRTFRIENCLFSNLLLQTPTAEDKRGGSRKRWQSP
jgi:hypothetical protein